jgi:hypothetical protein
VSKLKNFFEICRSEGWHYATSNAIRRIRYKMTGDYQIEKRLKRLSADIEVMVNSTVAYGPFKGLRFPPGTWWGIDRAGMYFGLYEQEILASLANIPNRYRTFINLGAADGYYGIGVLVNGMFDRSYCFEQSAKARDIIKASAELNGTGNVFIFGTADRDFYKVIPKADRDTSVLLADIEGGEFELLDEEMLQIFRHSIIFIELHDWIEDGIRKVARLRAAASEIFDITEITTTARDLSKFPELKNFSDIDRWLICSEGRGAMMTWFRLDPKRQGPI